MQDTTAPPLACGTKFPYWMNGTHPEKDDGEVVRTVCQTSADSDCRRSFNISVKQCGEFYVYKLVALPACPEAYCFGANDNCPPFGPCDFYEHTELEHNPDSLKCSSGEEKCDTFNPKQWFSFRDTSPLKYINTTTVPLSSLPCNTQSNFWLKGETKQWLNGTDVQTVCVHDDQSNCSQELHLLSKQCQSGFTVYKMPELGASQCHRFCLDEPAKTWSTCLVENSSYDNSTAAKLPNGPWLMLFTVFWLKCFDLYRNL